MLLYEKITSVVVEYGYIALCKGSFKRRIYDAIRLFTFSKVQNYLLKLSVVEGRVFRQYTANFL